jgi:hypothetical protein
LNNKKLWIAVAVMLWWVSFCTARDRCRPALFRYGIDVGTCPDGAVRQTAELDVTGLRRGGEGSVSLRAIAHYTARDADAEHTAIVPELSSIELSLTGGGSGPGSTQVLPLTGWKRVGQASVARLALPDLLDGDYQLHASYQTRLGKGEVSVPVALYAPARIHVITDRPLYEPGNTVRFRAVVLRARDLAPLDHRPGTWVVRDPENEVLLEEAAPAGDWGVVAGSFPLDTHARSGEWKIAWRSADAVDEVPFTVRPFTLPRFRIDAIAERGDL